MKEENDIDKLFNEKLSDACYTPKDSSWDKIAVAVQVTGAAGASTGLKAVIKSFLSKLGIGKTIVGLVVISATTGIVVVNTIPEKEEGLKVEEQKNGAINSEIKGLDNDFKLSDNQRLTIEGVNEKDVDFENTETEKLQGKDAGELVQESAYKNVDLVDHSKEVATNNGIVENSQKTISSNVQKLKEESSVVDNDRTESTSSAENDSEKGNNVVDSPKEDLQEGEGLGNVPSIVGGQNNDVEDQTDQQSNKDLLIAKTEEYEDQKEQVLENEQLNPSEQVANAEEKIELDWPKPMNLFDIQSFPNPMSLESKNEKKNRFPFELKSLYAELQFGALTSGFVFSGQPELFEYEKQTSLSLTPDFRLGVNLKKGFRFGLGVNTSQYEINELPSRLSFDFEEWVVYSNSPLAYLEMNINDVFPPGPEQEDLLDQFEGEEEEEDELVDGYIDFDQSNRVEQTSISFFAGYEMLVKRWGVGLNLGYDLSIQNTTTVVWDLNSPNPYYRKEIVFDGDKIHQINADLALSYAVTERIRPYVRLAYKRSLINIADDVEDNFTVHPYLYGLSFGLNYRF